MGANVNEWFSSVKKKNVSSSGIVFSRPVPAMHRITALNAHCTLRDAADISPKIFTLWEDGSLCTDGKGV